MSSQKTFLPRALAGLAIVLLVVLVVRYFQHRSTAQSPAPLAQAPAQTEPKAQMALNPSPVVPTAPVHVPPAAPEEIAATARMYAAHASLRTPDVADPDSAANKQILQTMVLKALAQQNTSGPAAASAK